MSQAHPHYVVITIGTTGDVHPFMRIAKALQTLGRKVTFITNAYHAKLLDGSGLTFIGLGTDEDYLRAVQNPDIWDHKKGFSVLMAHYRDQLDQINAAIRSAVDSTPTIAIVHPLAAPGAAIAREQALITSIVSAYLAPSTIRTCHDPCRIGPNEIPRWVPMSWRRALWRFVEKGWIDPVGLAHINAARDASNLPRVTSSLLTHIEDAPDLTVTLFPSWFGPAMPDWPQPLLSSDFQLFESAPQGAVTEEVSSFLSAADKPVVFTPGTGNLHAEAFFSSALSAVTRLGLRGIFLTKERAQVPASLPPSVLWLPYAPLSELLPHAAALVHHGGIGTTAEAMRAGTPQLIAPFGWDQFDNGARIASLGAGLVIASKNLHPRKMVRSLRTLITSESIRSHCLQLAQRFTEPNEPTGLCLEIERLV